MFGSLLKGLRIGLSLLLLLQEEGPLMSSFTKIFKVPVLIGSDGLDQFLGQLEAALDSDFPNYQVFFSLIQFQIVWTRNYSTYIIIFFLHVLLIN